MSAIGRDQDPERLKEPPDGGPPPRDAYGFAIAVITLLLTCSVALILALHTVHG